jgi:hypothetical protein
MRPQAAIGLILVVLGILAFSIHSVTYFTHEQVAGPLGFFAWDVAHPQTIFLNPLAGMAAVAIGIILMLVPRRATAL